MKIYIDIDNTICTTVDENDYSKSTPIQENINKVIAYIVEGHDVSFWTARGTLTGKNWEDVTHQQLDSWGLEGIPIIFGKPYFDLFIDDKVMNVSDW